MISRMPMSMREAADYGLVFSGEGVEEAEEAAKAVLDLLSPSRAE